MPFGLAGDDALRGLGGADCLYGGGGPDVLHGAAGADRLFGDARPRALAGGAGDDRLTDTAGIDSFDGGAGNDTIDARDRAVADRRQSDTVRCGAGRGDVALVDRSDRVATDCERVRRR